MLLAGSLVNTRAGWACGHDGTVKTLQRHINTPCRIGSGNILRQTALQLPVTRVSATPAIARFTDGGRRDEEEKLSERVVQVTRVTKVVKGGKQLAFRAVVVVGNEKGRVGVGCAAAKEVVVAVQKAVTDAKRHMISVPLSKGFSFPHKIDGIAGAARVMLRPASEGTGVIAGGAVRVVLELAGVKNAFGKQLGSANPLNNARATVDGLANMKTYRQVAEARNVTVEYLLKGSQMIGS